MLCSHAMLMLLIFALFSYFFLDRFIASSLIYNQQLLLAAKYLSKLGAPFFLLFCSFASLIIWRMRALRYLVTILISMFLAGNLKMLARRPRPYLYLQEDLYGFFLGNVEKGFLSFPSSHAAVCVGLALLFSEKFPRYKIAIYSAATLIMLTRIILKQHFLSDLLVGAWIGYVSALFVLKIEKLLQDRSLIIK
ncbi:MAG: phosphatase PAP2 family protein [Chlamydiae bacterium]|nr:phosphatase PAP2 family protein [Chlamydiota bacterium]